MKIARVEQGGARSRRKDRAQCGCIGASALQVLEVAIGMMLDETS